MQSQLVSQELMVQKGLVPEVETRAITEIKINRGSKAGANKVSQNQRPEPGSKTKSQIKKSNQNQEKKSRIRGCHGSYQNQKLESEPGVKEVT